MNTCYVGVIIIVLIMAATMGCTESGKHNPYDQVTVIEKFEKSQPMQFVDPKLVSNPAWYTHDYYIRYTNGGVHGVDRVSKDVYNSIFVGNTYVLKWGYIDDFTSTTKEYGYVEMILKVEKE